MKNPTYYYVEYHGLPGQLFLEAPLKWLDYLKTLDKQLVIATALDNMLSVIQQTYNKMCAPDEKDKLTLKLVDYNRSYVFKFLNWEVLTLKEAFLCTSNNEKEKGTV